MVVVVDGELIGATGIGQVSQVLLLRRIGQRISAPDAVPTIVITSTGGTHHLEGVGEGKSMVLGVGLMLSLFVFDR